MRLEGATDALRARFDDDVARALHRLTTAVKAQSGRLDASHKVARDKLDTLTRCTSADPSLNDAFIRAATLLGDVTADDIAHLPSWSAACEQLATEKAENAKAAAALEDLSFCAAGREPRLEGLATRVLRMLTFVRETSDPTIGAVAIREGVEAIAKAALEAFVRMPVAFADVDNSLPSAITQCTAATALADKLRLPHLDGCDVAKAFADSCFHSEAVVRRVCARDADVGQSVRRIADNLLDPLERQRLIALAMP